MENKNLAISFILIVIGMILLFSNNDIAFGLTDVYLFDKGFGEVTEIEIFKNYSNAVLIMGGVLFYRGIYMLTEFLWKK
ncbi:hypothetical protein [Clostridium sp. MD294]|uniref:hypothetical protein n=1 Tax=Clostridium sp. MD294 TaxID=97138 RepID=UPI0002C95142|nr:hypothetical protein [Clostridium sp. MD294]NDO46364.1 hypothetical protein [Clostridium sp. MD294]USF29209.1 hypothetical protein C820_000593 [Clostridium sp. MD294]